MSVRQSMNLSVRVHADIILNIEISFFYQNACSPQKEASETLKSLHIIDQNEAVMGIKDSVAGKYKKRVN